MIPSGLSIGLTENCAASKFSYPLALFLPSLQLIAKNIQIHRIPFAIISSSTQVRPLSRYSRGYVGLVKKRYVDVNMFMSPKIKSNLIKSQVIGYGLDNHQNQFKIQKSIAITPSMIKSNNFFTNQAGKEPVFKRFPQFTQNYQ